MYFKVRQRCFEEENQLEKVAADFYTDDLDKPMCVFACSPRIICLIVVYI